eukprot:scaffold29802_cov46-Prasinocladus_malaysianus.AAC.2
MGHTSRCNGISRHTWYGSGQTGATCSLSLSSVRVSHCRRKSGWLGLHSAICRSLEQASSASQALDDDQEASIRAAAQASGTVSLAWLPGLSARSGARPDMASDSDRASLLTVAAPGRLLAKEVLASRDAHSVARWPIPSADDNPEEVLLPDSGVDTAALASLTTVGPGG